MAVLRAGRDGAPPLDYPAPAPRRRRPIDPSRAVIAALLGCLAAVLLLAPPAGAQGAESPPSLVLSPSKVRTEAVAGIGLGPFGLTNETSTAYRVRVLPVFLDQTLSCRAMR